MLEGKLIALEGLDGAGTTSQLGLLEQQLQRHGYTSFATFEPSSGWLGQGIRARLRRELEETCSEELFALLFAADRLHHVQQDLLPRLQQQHVVITDRYLLSSLVYQSSKLPLAWIEQLNAYAPPADITIYVAVSAQTAAKRRAQRAEAPEWFESITRQQLVAARYAELLAQPHPCLGQLLIIDGEQPLAQVTQAILEQLSPLAGKDLTIPQQAQTVSS